MKNVTTTISTPHGPLLYSFNGNIVTMENARTVEHYFRLMLADMEYNERCSIIATICDPQEVYFAEYNKNQCATSWYGDEPAFEQVKTIFGEDVAKSIKRINNSYL